MNGQDDSTLIEKLFQHQAEGLKIPSNQPMPAESFRQEMLKYFEVGCLVQEIEGTESLLTVQSISKMFDVPVSLINKMVKIVLYFDKDKTKFLHDLDRLHCYTIAGYLKAFETLYGSQTAADPFETISANISKIELNIKLYGSQEDTYPKMKKLLQRLERTIPPQMLFKDTDYLKYYSCACCHEIAPEEGFDLAAYNGILYLQYPICAECLKAGSQPEIETMLLIYGNYAHSLERAYYQSLYGLLEDRG